MTFSDLKLRPVWSGDYYLDSLTVFDYYPFGMLKPGRYYEGAWSRYGFNGKEKDDESYLADHGVRKYHNPLGRFTSPDPLWEKYYKSIG